MKLSKEQIEAINKKCSYDIYGEAQGVFTQPSGVPTDIKTPVVYMCWETGGMMGGGYHADCELRSYTSDEPIPKFVALDLVLKELAPNISYLQYREIEGLIKEGNDWSRGEDYYGNRTDYDSQYIILSELIEKLKSFK